MRFSESEVSTLITYELPFEADQMILLDDKAFFVAISYSNLQVAIYDIKFASQISLKDFSM